MAKGTKVATTSCKYLVLTSYNRINLDQMSNRNLFSSLYNGNIVLRGNGGGKGKGKGGGGGSIVVAHSPSHSMEYMPMHDLFGGHHGGGHGGWRR